jgi:uncharacterized protein YndB with AHSA1/START domain
MQPNITAEISITISAEKKAVWDALTNPETVKQYFFDSNLSTSWEPGAPIVFNGAFNGEIYEDNGIVLAFNPEEMLQYTYRAGRSDTAAANENECIITYRMGGDNGNVTVTVIQENIPTINTREQAIANWTTVLGNLKKLLETNEIMGT